VRWLFDLEKLGDMRVTRTRLHSLQSLNRLAAQ